MIRSRLLLVLAFAGLVGCSGDLPGPTSAILELTLNAPAGDDGAILLTVSGGPIDSIEAPGYSLYSTALARNTYRLIVAGSIRPGSIARILIPDEARAGDYSAAVDQVAARTSYQLRDPTGYKVSLAP